jgi:hypothetical protein
MKPDSDSSQHGGEDSVIDMKCRMNFSQWIVGGLRERHRQFPGDLTKA